MAQQHPLKIILGSGTIGVRALADQNAKTFLEDFRKHGGTEVDCAPVYPIYDDYGSAERTLATHAGPWAEISTKINMSLPNALNKENIAKSVETSTETLKGRKIDIMYFHIPDNETDLSESMEAIDKEYRAGKFKRFGISNYSPARVSEIVKIARDNGYVKPSVYQGHYNLLGRTAEAELLPLLRKHEIAYYAYSPAAAGFMTGKVTRASADENGRWSSKEYAGQAYIGQYHNDPMFDAAKQIIEVAQKHGIAGHAAAIRWCLHHSALSKQYGDGAILGASNLEQSQNNLEVCGQGPLPNELVEKIEDMWPVVRDTAPAAWFP